MLDEDTSSDQRQTLLTQLLETATDNADKDWLMVGKMISDTSLSTKTKLQYFLDQTAAKKLDEWPISVCNPGLLID